MRKPGTLTTLRLWLAAILLLEPDLDANYQNVKAQTFPWNRVPRTLGSESE